MDPEKLRAFNALQARKSSRSFKLKFAQICYYYPQYKLEEVMLMQPGDTDLLLKVAQYQEISSQLAALNVAAASTEKKSYQSLRSSLKKELDRIEAIL